MATMILGLMAGEMLRGPLIGASPSSLHPVGGGRGVSAARLAGGRVRLPDRQAHLDAVVGGLQRRLDVPDAGGVLRRHRRASAGKRWAFPLAVVGMNSIAMYCMSQLMRGFLRERLRMHLEPQWFSGMYGPILESAAILLVFWLICWWMYRRGIFLRI